jgi:23S rRNA pseudouridine2457 synthase
MPLILFNKPFQVLCQFSPQEGRESLADYLTIPGIYPAGRLDADSEGLMLLTDDGKLQHKIAHPDHKEAKTYLVQVDGVPDADAGAPAGAARPGRLRHQALPRGAIAEPEWLWPRNPPIRARQDKPTSWIAITLEEGKNRQVRRMTAAVGLPTLRLVRSSIGPFRWQTHPLMPGEFVEVPVAALRANVNTNTNMSIDQKKPRRAEAGRGFSCGTSLLTCPAFPAQR